MLGLAGAGCPHRMMRQFLCCQSLIERMPACIKAEYRTEGPSPASMQQSNHCVVQFDADQSLVCCCMQDQVFLRRYFRRKACEVRSATLPAWRRFASNRFGGRPGLALKTVAVQAREQQATAPGEDPARRSLSDQERRVHAAPAHWPRVRNTSWLRPATAYRMNIQPGVRSGRQ